MKILFSSIIDLQKSYHNRPHQFVKHLSKKHEITIISVNDWWKATQHNNDIYGTDLERLFQKIEYRYLTNRKIQPVFQELLCKNQIGDLSKEKFDIHLNYNSLIMGNALSKNNKTVFDIADDLISMIRLSPQIPVALRPLGAILGEYFLQKNITSAKKITLTTRVLQSTYNIPTTKSEVIPNGVDTILFKKHEGAKQELGFEGFIVGYVGVLREWIDLDSVFRALPLVANDIKLLIVGKEGQFNEYVRLAKELAIDDRVIFVGSVPYSQVPKYISAMDVCLIPFKQDAISHNAMPLKFFEYMACEKPIITSEIPGIREIANDGVFYAQNSKEYANSILELYHDETLCKNFIKKGRAIVESNYSWEKIAQKIENILLATCNT